MGLISMFDHDGREIDLKTLGVTGLKLDIPSPSYRTETKELDGGGVVVLHRELESRELTAHFFSQAKTYEDSLRIKDNIYNFLGNGKPFYVSETKNPLKRWKVYLGEWTPERLTTKVHTFDISLAVESGASESINVIEKAFTTSKFNFKNEGAIPIDPRKQIETEIRFKGTSSGLNIKNLTTGDIWSYKDSTVDSDVILLKGVRSLKNGASIFGQTNKKIITIAPGWNSFELSGVSGSFELSIRSRFYYL